MAVANTKSTEVTNADATPLVFNPKGGQKLLVKGATLAVAAADDDTSVYRFFRVKSNWVIWNLLRWNDAITGGTAFEIGLHDIAATNSGAVVDANLFGTTVDLSSASVVPVDERFEVLNITGIGLQVWELLGETADTNKWYDLTMTATTVGSAAGDISLQIVYSN